MDPDVTFAGPRTRRERGWTRVAVGALLILAGFAAVGLGIVNVIGERDKIDADAVARGSIGEPLRFSTPGGDYTVFLIFSGGLGSTDRQDRAVSRTTCEMTASDGARTELRGSRQGFSITIGSASSVGHFEVGAGDVEVLCEATHGEQAELVITPGRPGIVRSVAMIIGGAFIVVAGGFLLGWGLIGKRVPV